MEAAGRLGLLLENATTTGPGGAAGPAPKGVKTLHAYLIGTGAVSATVKVEVSNFNPAVVASSWVTAATFTLSGTTVATDAATLEGPYGYYRANVTAISGTGATVSVSVNQ